MSEAENHTQSIDVASVQANPLPVEMGRPLEVHPDGIQASADPLNIKKVPLGKSKILTKNSILAMHTLNLPFKERLILGMKWYKKILAMVEKFDYEHEKEYFEVYRELIVAEDTEDWSSMSTSEFLYFRRELISRLVNRLLNYYEDVLVLDGCFANLSILSYVNGTGKFKTFGLACKWSYINSASNTFDDFIQPVGAIDYIGEYSKWCVGETNQNTVFVSIPEWNTSVYGNAGQHSFNWSDIIASWSMDGDEFWLPDTSSPDYDTYHKLLKNMTRVITRYGQDISLEDSNGVMRHASKIADLIDPANQKTVTTSVSHLENGASLTFIDKYGEHDTWALNADTSVIYHDFTNGIRGGNGAVLHSDNIINRAWDSYNYQVTYMQEFYDDIFQRNSVIRRFMKEHLSDYFTDGVVNIEFHKKINADAAFDAGDFQKKRMVYKGKGAVTTATVVGREPVYCDIDETPTDSQNFALNFQRIKFNADSEEELLRTAKEHIRLTPTMFDSLCDYSGDEDKRGSSTVTVLNGLGSASYLVDADGVDTPIHSPLGMFASMLDRTMAYASKNPQNNSISVIGAVPDDVKTEFVEHASDHTIVFDKDPENVWVPTMPLVDSSDPYQCGWNIIVSEESVHPNVWEKYFRDPSNYLKLSSSPDSIGVYSPTAGSGTSLSPNSHNSLSFAMDSDKKNVLCHVINPSYLEMVKHAKIFVGDAIWELPDAIATRYQAGNYCESMVFARDGDAGADATALRTLLIDKLGNWQDPQALDEAALESLDPDDMIQYLIGLASCPNDPSLPTDEIQYIMSPFNWLQQWWQDFKSIAPLSVWEVHQWTFSPAYGPVVPVVYEIPAHLPATIPSQTVIEGISSVDSYTDDTSDIDLGMGSPVQMQAPASGYPMFQAFIRFAMDSFNSVGQYLLWFLDNFQFTKTVKDQWNMYIADTKVKLPGFSGPAKHAFALLARGSVYHMGSGNFDSVFEETSRMNLDPDKPSIDTVKVDMGNLVVPPKVDVKKITRSSLSSWRDRGVKMAKLKSFTAISASDGKNDTSGESPEKKQSSGGKENNKSPRYDKGQGTVKKPFGKDFVKKPYGKKGEKNQEKDSEKDNPFQEKAGMAEV